MGDAVDRVNATNLALLGMEYAKPSINKMIGEARKVVEQHWPDIEALAERLLVNGRVNFLENPKPELLKAPTPADT